MICLNNDTRLVTPNFLKQVENVYQRTQAGVIGPMVLQGDGKFTGNPLLLKPRTLRDVDNILTENKRRLFGLTHGLFGQIFLKLYDTRRQRLNRKRGDSATEQEKALVSLKEQMNIILHGCFLIFTPLFFSSLSGFDERTFLYLEEDILYERCREAGIIMIYEPDLVIFHYEGATVYRNGVRNLEVQKMRVKNLLQSATILREQLIKNSSSDL